MSRAAAQNVEIAFESIFVDSDTMLKRLVDITDNLNNLSKDTCSLRSRVRFSTFAHTSLYESKDIKLIYYKKFVQNDEQLVISFE